VVAERHQQFELARGDAAQGRARDLVQLLPVRARVLRQLRQGRFVLRVRHGSVPRVAVGGQAGGSLFATPGT